MRFKLYKQYGAKNSQPVFDALAQGLRSLGHELVNENEDVPVIWSVLWSGRMADNQKIYQQAKKTGKPVLILEVGNLKRGLTWRISIDNINGFGYFGNDKDLDSSRPEKLSLSLFPPKKSRKSEILIACQHIQSLQWADQPGMESWAKHKISELRQYTDRPVIVRPHPRSPFSLSIQGATLEKPVRIPNTYDDFNIDYEYHSVINHNSGPAVQAAIRGIPIVCDISSLAYPVSDQIKNIESPILPDREDWFVRLCHTEWTIQEISSGMPMSRLMSRLIS